MWANLLFAVLCVFISVLWIYWTPKPGKSDLGRPNLLILLADDLGYGDLACYGSTVQEPGPIDGLAASGIRFTQFYSADSLCSPARAGLLTGRLPIRSGAVGGKRVFLPTDTGGLPASELTLAELLRDAGYRTGMVGKWHLGINAHNASDGTYLPSRNGFDFVGLNLPMTNLWECDERGIFVDKPSWSRCFLYRGDNIIQQPFQHENLTVDMLADFRGFLHNQGARDRPFFFYFSFPHVHTDLHASKPFQGSSKRGMFGDYLSEMAWAVGEIRSELDSRALLNQTLILFLSDHGPHKEICRAGGSTGPFKGGKANTWEGGFRIPTIASWPGVIPQGAVSEAVLWSLDIFPTFASLAQAQLPSQLILDGLDMTSQLSGISSASPDPDRCIFFYCNRHLMAVRYRNFKIHYYTVPLLTVADTGELCPGGWPLKDWYVSLTCPDTDLICHSPPLVYDLDQDPGELYEIPDPDAGILNAAQICIKTHRATLTHVPDQMGHFSGDVIPCCDPPRCRCNYPGPS